VAKHRIRVLCVDDHTVMRQGIALLLSQQRDIQVVASAANGEQAIEQFKAHRPDITLMDLQLPGIDGFEAIRAIRDVEPDTKIIVLTMYRGDEDIHRALKAGAAAYLLKDTLADDLIRVVREVFAGGRPVSLDVANELDKRRSQPMLTARELQVMELLAQGLRNREIAERLGISEDTIQVHIRGIFTKFNVHDRTAAVAVATRRGIVHLL
jgi:DNA-binding NarL/FixJ family response regulator